MLILAEWHGDQKNGCGLMMTAIIHKFIYDCGGV
jgi:hypothetical protein